MTGRVQLEYLRRRVPTAPQPDRNTQIHFNKTEINIHYLQKRRLRRIHMYHILCPWFGAGFSLRCRSGHQLRLAAAQEREHLFPPRWDNHDQRCCDKRSSKNTSNRCYWNDPPTIIFLRHRVSKQSRARLSIFFFWTCEERLRTMPKSRHMYFESKAAHHKRLVQFAPPFERYNRPYSTHFQTRRSSTNPHRCSPIGGGQSKYSVAQ